MIDDSGYPYILGYGVIIALMIFIMKFKAGYAAIYYMSILALLLLVLAESKFIVQSVSIFGPGEKIQNYPRPV